MAQDDGLNRSKKSRGRKSLVIQETSLNAPAGRAPETRLEFDFPAAEFACALSRRQDTFYGKPMRA
jgi:hypothetical protein